MAQTANSVLGFIKGVQAMPEETFQAVIATYRQRASEAATVDVRDEYELMAKQFEQARCTVCTSQGFGPSHYGSLDCKSGSLASGGHRSHCSCEVCF